LPIIEANIHQLFTRGLSGGRFPVHLSWNAEFYTFQLEYNSNNHAPYTWSAS